MNYPFKKVHITQEWGVNEDIYKRFGFKGHNGIDFRLFDDSGVRSTTSLLFAPHDGVVKERRFDANGYGNYLKIESETEGSILGHLKEFKVNVNKHVKEGDSIGIADNTGWSTGSHLVPRNLPLFKFGGRTSPNTFISFTRFFSHFWVLISSMTTVAFTQLKIFYSIIKKITIDVMNHLTPFKKSTNVFFHDQSVTSNISLFSTVGMIPVFNIMITRTKNLTLILGVFSRIRISLLKRLSNLFSSFFRSFFTKPVFSHMVYNNPSVILCQ